MTKGFQQVSAAASPSELRPGRASLLLAERFPALLLDVEGKAESMYLHLVSRAERVNEQNGRCFLNEPDIVAASFIVSAAMGDWRLVGGAEPGDKTEQKAAFGILTDKLASHMLGRAKDRAYFRRERPSSSSVHEGGLSVVVRPGSALRTWRGLPAAEDDPAEAVVIHLEAVRVIRHIRRTLRSDVQRTFLAKLEKRPDLASSLGVHGQGGFIAEELGISQAAARQLLSRIRAAVVAIDEDDAA